MLHRETAEFFSENELLNKVTIIQLYVYIHVSERPDLLGPSVRSASNQADYLGAHFYKRIVLI